MTNIKHILYKVTNKDKDYNLSVAKVSQREIKLDLIKDKINQLDREFIQINNSASINTTESNKAFKNSQLDNEQNELIEQEQKLREELKDIKDKNENIELIYKKVLENMIVITKYQKHEETSLDDLKKQKSYNFEDELIRQYNEYLFKMNDLAKKTYSKVKFSFN